jgi:cell wall-active antibiotic response 4TMS protein YvqF
MRGNHSGFPLILVLVNNVWRHPLFWPSVLIVLGVYFLLQNLGLLNWLRADIFWPLVLILIGVWLIVRRART